MPRKKKPLDNSTCVKKDQVGIAWWKDIKTLFGWEGAPLTPAAVNKYAEVLLEWSMDDNSISFQDFYRKIGMPRQNFDQYRQHHPILEKSYQMAKDNIGERREKIAIFKKYGSNPGVVMFTMRKYNTDWQECYNEDQAHKKDQATNVLEKYFEKYELELPELDEQDKDSVSSRDNKVPERV